MGKVAAAAEMKQRKKKKGRPSLLDLQKRTLKEQQQQQQQKKSRISSSPNRSTPTRRSTRRDPNPGGISPAPDLIEGDDDDERKEKKVKLVVRLPQSNQHLPRSSSLNSASCGSDSNGNGDNHEVSVKKRKINAVGDRSGDTVTDQGQKVSKATDTLHGSPLESGPTTPLPDKKLLLFILDRLQKKDTHGVFSELVDPNELPDYHEIIEHPMDFGTLRKKLDEGLYLNLEELEADVFLICSNAMQYNSPSTVYFRQARSIQELAKRDFENLRQEGDDGELQPKVVRRGRPPSKNLKKSLGRSPVDRVGPELSSGATLATGEDNTNGSNAYNLRRGPMLYRFQSTDASVTSHRSRNGDFSEWLSDWNDEFPASILKADMKYGKKQFSVDETRRDTYRQFHPSAFGHGPSVLSNVGGDMKQLMAVGLHLEHGYARSLARFAANLGPVVWKIASKKFESVLPSGLTSVSGLMGENEVSLQPPFFSSEKQESSHNLACDGHPSRPGMPSTAGINSVVANSSLQGKEDMVEAGRGLNSQKELAVPKSCVPGIRPGLSFQTQNKPVFHADKNGYNGVFGYNLPSQMGMARLATPTGQSELEEASVPSKRSDTQSSHSAPTNHIYSEEPKLENSSMLYSSNLAAPYRGPDSHTAPEVGHSGKQSWHVLSPHQRQYSLPVPPDLNVRLQAPGSPNSGLRIGSPQQPDLALQL